MDTYSKIRSLCEENGISIGSLATAIGEEVTTIEDVVEPYLLQGDWICIKKVSFNEVRHQGVYLVDTVNDGKMIKRISLLDDGDYLLSLPVPNTNYPIITRKKEEIYDFYELVSRIQNSPSIIFNQPSIIKEMIKNGMIDDAKTAVSVRGCFMI